MRRCVSLLVTALLILASARSSSAASSSERSWRRARQVLDAALEATGGLAALQGIRTFTLRETGQYRYVDQGLEPPEISPREELTLVDFTRNRLAIDTRISEPSYYLSLSGVVIDAKNGYTLDHWSREAAPLSNASVAAYRAHFAQRLPHFVLLEAFERSMTLRWVGEGEDRGRKTAEITYVAPDGRQTTLVFDAATRLLRKIEWPYSDAVRGDALHEIVFKDYETVSGVKVPSGRVLKVAGEWQIDVAYDRVEINTALPDQAFAVPAAYARRPEPPRVPFHIVEVAKDVFLARGLEGSGGNALFFALEDQVVLVDAPISRTGGPATDRLLAKIREKIPDKPIRRLVLTTSSFDHAAGLRSLVAAGATIVAPPRMRRWAEDVVAARHTISPDALSRNPRPLVVEPFEGRKHVLGDGRRRVELHEIGPSPTLNESVIVHFPAEKILYQTDLFNPGYVRTVIPAQAATLHFWERLQTLGLDVETIIGGHGDAMTMADLRRAVEMRRERDAGGTTPSAEATSTGEFERLMQTLADGWNEGDARKAAHCFTPDAVYVEPPDKQIYRGRQELFRFFGGESGRGQPMKMTWHHLVYDPERQIGAGEFTFDYGGPVHGMVVVKIRAGKISNWREYWYESPLAWPEFIGANPF